MSFRQSRLSQGGNPLPPARYAPCGKRFHRRTNLLKQESLRGLPFYDTLRLGRMPKQSQNPASASSRGAPLIIYTPPENATRPKGLCISGKPYLRRTKQLKLQFLRGPSAKSLKSESTASFLIWISLSCAPCTRH